MANWFDLTTTPEHADGHARPLIIQQNGDGVYVTNFNGELKEELKLIHAKHRNFTMHGIHNTDTSAAHENPMMRNDSIMPSTAHGVHAKNYLG